MLGANPNAHRSPWIHVDLGPSMEEVFKKSVRAENIRWLLFGQKYDAQLEKDVACLLDTNTHTRSPGRKDYTTQAQYVECGEFGVGEREYYIAEGMCERASQNYVYSRVIFPDQIELLRPPLVECI